MNNQRKSSRTHLSFVKLTTILFCCQGDEFIHTILSKRIYPYMYDWEKIYKKELLEKENIYRNLNLEDITDEDYIHAKRVYRNFEIKNLGEYHDLYLISDVIRLTDVFVNFRKMCLEIYELDSVKFISAPSLACQAALKKAQVELDLIADIDMLLMIEKVLEEENVKPSIIM